MSKASSDVAAELDQLRLRIHQAPLEPYLWDGVLGSVTRLVGARSSHLTIFDRETLALSLLMANNIDPDAQRLYREHWHKHDIWLHHLLEVPSGSVIVGQDVVPDDVLFTTEVYNEYLKHYDMSQVLTNVAENSDKLWSAMTVQRARRDSEFGVLERRILHSLTPHLATAIAVHVRLAGLEDRARASEAALDRLPVGVCLIDQSARIMYQNAAADATLSAGDGLAERSGGLLAASADESRDLAARIALAVATGLGKARSAGSLLSISRPSMRRPYSVAVAPLPAARDQTNGLIGETRPCAIVLLTDPEQEPCYPADFLARCYGLTAAEARLACAIVAGRSLQDAADEFGVTTGTARNQLKQIFAKTDVKRQAELVRLLSNDLAARAAALVASPS